jgi:hypothetical protein
MSKNAQKEMYRLPGGEYTKHHKKYTTAWRALAKPFKRFGWKLHSFDPDVVMSDEIGNTHSFSVYEATVIGRAIDGKPTVTFPTSIKLKGRHHESKN